MEMNNLPIKELRTLLAAVASHGDQHLAEIDADLQQTAFLLDEAIVKLSNSFMTVHELITKQHQTIDSFGQEKIPTAQQLDTLKQIKEQVGQEVNAVVTGMQFQDMTNQLLHRTIKRVNGLKELLQELAQHGDDINPVQEHQDIIKFLENINETLDASSHALSGNLRKSVGQKDMSTGDIDLF